MGKFEHFEVTIDGIRYEVCHENTWYFVSLEGDSIKGIGETIEDAYLDYIDYLSTFEQITRKLEEIH
jgi:hypothetical protein